MGGIRRIRRAACSLFEGRAAHRVIKVSLMEFPNLQKGPGRIALAWRRSVQRRAFRLAVNESLLWISERAQDPTFLTKVRTAQHSCTESAKLMYNPQNLRPTNVLSSLLRLQGKLINWFATEDGSRWLKASASIEVLCVLIFWMDGKLNRLTLLMTVPDELKQCVMAVYTLRACATTGTSSRWASSMHGDRHVIAHAEQTK